MKLNATLYISVTLYWKVCVLLVITPLVHYEAILEIKPLDSVTYPPTLTQYDQWGHRVDHLHTSEGWRRVKDICIREGIVAVPYERKHGEYSRLHGFAKSILTVGYGNVVSFSFGSEVYLLDE